MAKITKLDTKTYPGKDPSITVTLDNGVIGYLQKESDKDLKEGDEVDVTTKPYTSTKGKTSTLITLIRKRATKTVSPQSQPDLRMPPEAKNFFRDNVYSKNPKLEVPFHSMRLVMDAFIEGKIVWDNLPKAFAEMNGLLLAAIDECGKENSGSEKSESK